MASQPSSSTTTSTAATKVTTKTLNKTQTIGKFPQKVAQQLLNAKFISQDFQKIIVGQQQASQKGAAKGVVVSKGSGSGTNMVRMVNAANLNLTHIGGKPVLLAGKILCKIIFFIF